MASKYLKSEECKAAHSQTNALYTVYLNAHSYKVHGPW